MNFIDVAIIGGGLAGLSCSKHITKRDKVIFEKNNYYGGHATTHNVNNSFWDEGPHISFSTNKYVKKMFSKSLNEEFFEFPVKISNYYKGYWIPHPAQENWDFLPKDIKERCLDSYISKKRLSNNEKKFSNYKEWLDNAFGEFFANEFAGIYTKKYWTCNPEELSTDWISNRIKQLNISDFKDGYMTKRRKNSHYINMARYPKKGGFKRYSENLYKEANLIYTQVKSIDLRKSELTLSNGIVYKYAHLINTSPLDEFISLIKNVPNNIKFARSKLRCTSLILINIIGYNSSPKPYHWLYVYDKDKLSTRITQINKLSEFNTPKNKLGIQVEVYKSNLNSKFSIKEIESIVRKEIIDMGLLTRIVSSSTQYVKHANIIFDHDRKFYQNIIFNWLEKFGLEREEDDLEAITKWDQKIKLTNMPKLFLAGRFAQWKYYWTDDCILRGALLSKL